VCTTYDRRHDKTIESLCRAIIVGGGYALDPSRAAKIIASQRHGLWL
jgi:hypothetical protein